jgi:DNA-binding transcriptional LysR family regulator
MRWTQPLSGRLRVNAAEGSRAAVLADQGLTIASQWMFAPELDSGAVVPVMKEWTLPDQDLWAMFPTRRMASAKAHAFVEYLTWLLAQND